jgi:hypothetical protein
MAIRFRADGTIPRAAIYEASDDAPFSAPLSHLSRVKFHTDFDYLSFNSGTPTISTTVTVNGSLGHYQYTHDIGAHGAAGTPFAFGRVFVSGAWQPLTGTVPVVQFISAGESNLICFNLAVSASQVYIIETRSFNSSGAFSSAALSVQVYVSRQVA